MKRGYTLAKPALLGSALPLLLAASLSAQSADFLFRRPWVSLGIRGGYTMPRAQSDVFDDNRRILTIETSDFHAASFGGELAVRATERIDVALSVDWSRSKTRSEFREFVEEGPTPGTDDDLPIEQTTTFQRVPATISVKGYLFERGRSISRFAWVPAKWSPYLGAGVGMMKYRYEQVGDFVDYVTFEIFTDSFLSEGTTPTAHVMAGADVSLGPRFILTSEARYSWARTEMDSFQFRQFDSIDLAGLQMTAGISVRF